MNESKHTPGPWSVCNAIGKKSEVGIVADAAPCIIAVMGNQGRGAWPQEARANAEFIVRACNSHYELLEALRELVSACTRYDEQDEHSALLAANYCAAKDRAIAVIAKAECQP
jgi:hypothetical protein